VTICVSPNGVNVYAAASPPRRVLVATLTGVKIVARPEVDAPWEVRAPTDLTAHVSALLVEPGTGTAVAGAHHGRVFASGDDGETWTARDSGLSIDHVFSLRVGPSADGPLLYAGTEPVSLFRSADLGAHWVELPAIHDQPGTERWTFPGPPHVAHTKTLAIDPRQPDVMYAGVEQGALLATSDGGQSWHELDAYYTPADTWYRDIHQVVLRPTAPDELFMTTGIGLYHSPDRGQSWTHLTTPDFRIGYPDQLVITADGSELFMAGAERDPTTWRASHLANSTVLRSRDSGRSWTSAAGGLPAPLRANIEALTLASYPGGFSLFAGTTDGDLFSSDDAGEHWTRIARDLTPISKGGHYRNLQAAA
jgi:photosystem II stability/assembly factor-like uncharacterized protein